MIRQITLLLILISACQAGEFDNVNETKSEIPNYGKPRIQRFRCYHFAECLPYWDCPEIHRSLSNDNIFEIKSAQRSYCGENHPAHPWVCCYEPVVYRDTRHDASRESDRLPVLGCGWSNLNLITPEARKYFDREEPIQAFYKGHLCSVKNHDINPKTEEEESESNDSHNQDTDVFYAWRGKRKRNAKLDDTEVPNYNSETQREKRLTGASPSRLGQWPWIAALFYGFHGKHHVGASPAYGCIGNIINSRYIVTTASCCLKKEASFPMYAGVGDFDFHGGFWNETKSQKINGVRYNETEKPQLLRIKKIHIHPKHRPFNRTDNSSLVNNIALLEVKPRIKFNELVQPICLQTDETPKIIIHLKPGFNFTIVSYGYSRYRFSPYEHKGQLRHTNVPILPNRMCYIDIHDISILMCFGGVKAGYGCNDVDGGAPLMRQTEDGRFYLSSIALNFGPEDKPGSGCPSADKPFLATHVEHYLEWIISIVEPQAK